MRYNVVSDYFTYIIVTFAFIWFAKYLYGRRALYKLAYQLDGPLAWPIIGNALWFVDSSEVMFRSVLLLATKYVSPCRIWIANRLYIIITQPKDLEIILSSPKSLEKDSLYSFLTPLLGNSLLSAPVAVWKRHRKIILPTFNKKILDTFMDVFVEQSHVLVKHLEKHVNTGYFDIQHPVSLSLLDIVCETIMGIRVNAQNQNCTYMSSVQLITSIIWQRGMKVWYNVDFIFNWLPVAKQYHGAIEDIHAFTDSVIKQKQREMRQTLSQVVSAVESNEDETKLPKRKAFLEMLVELCEQGSTFTDQELREEVDVMMIAGSDTSASVISFACAMLGAHPTVQERVYKELVQVYGESSWHVTVQSLPRLQYLERVLKETMRLFPPGPIVMRTITDDLTIESCTLPSGTSVIIPIFAIHKDPAFWPDPLKFDPDRFLPEEVAKRHPYSYLPFSGGLRKCIGGQYAMMAMKTQLAIVLQQYKFRARAKPADIRLAGELILKAVEGILVEIEKRE